MLACNLIGNAKMKKTEQARVTKSAVTTEKQGPDTQQNFRSKGIKLNGTGFYYILVFKFFMS